MYAWHELSNRPNYLLCHDRSYVLYVQVPRSINNQMTAAATTVNTTASPKGDDRCIYLSTMRNRDGDLDFGLVDIPWRMVLIAFCYVLLIAQPKGRKRKREACAVGEVQYEGTVDPTARKYSSGALIAVTGDPDHDYEVYETTSDVGS